MRTKKKLMWGKKIKASQNLRAGGGSYNDFKPRVYIYTHKYICITVSGAILLSLYLKNKKETSVQSHDH